MNFRAPKILTKVGAIFALNQSRRRPCLVARCRMQLNPDSSETDRIKQRTHEHNNGFSVPLSCLLSSSYVMSDSNSRPLAESQPWSVLQAIKSCARPVVANQFNFEARAPLAWPCECAAYITKLKPPTSALALQSVETTLFYSARRYTGRAI